MKKAIILCGPTASGKTQLSITLGRMLNAEIINADSRQVYKYMDIGTAKPGKEERELIPHYFVDIIKPDEHYDAGLFGEQAREKIDEIISRDKLPMVVGGSGLYIRSVVDGLFEGPKRNEIIRQELELRLKEKGPMDLFEEIKKVDPDTAMKLDPANPHRLIRVLEVYYLTNESLSTLQKQNKIQINFTPVFYGIRWERDLLYKRVNKRAEKMVCGGLVEECTNLLKMGYDRDLKALQTVGYKECFDFLEEKIGFSELIDLIQKNTRHYVKRQFTWFNHEKRLKWFDLCQEDDFKLVAEEIAADFLKDQ